MKKSYTQLVNFDTSPGDIYAPSSTPIYQTATFDLLHQGDKVQYDYTRSGNPTRTVLEQQIAKLEFADYALSFATGMAAINALMGVLKSGEHVIAARDLYGGTYRLLKKRLESHHNISVSFVDVTNLVEIKKALQKNTKLLILETPSNPLQQIANLNAIADICIKAKIIFAVDNSAMSPWLQNPLKFGATVVIHSATKFLSGHSDVSGGFLVLNDKSLQEEIKFIQNAEGAGLAPFDCWLLLRSVKTLGLRIDRQQHNALKVVDFLSSKKLVKKIYYPGLANHPGHLLHKKQSSGFGSVISIEVKNLKEADALIKLVKLFKVSVSFGSINSSICLPIKMSHQTMVDLIPANLLRISVGIEDADDLIADLQYAFTKLK